MRDYLTYRYPRTILEAFGCDARSATAIYGPYRRTPGPVRFIFKISITLGALFLLGVAVQGV